MVFDNFSLWILFSSIDFDINTMRIYWSDSKLRSIWRAYINGSDPHRIIDLGLVSPEGIAVDWLGLNIYWTDPVAHRIEVARLDGTSRRTLLWGEVYEPHSIVLDPKEGYKFLYIIKHIFKFLFNSVGICIGRNGVHRNV